VNGRTSQVPDVAFDRLVLLEIKRGSNSSAVLSDILDRALLKHEIATDE
jgi:hypothetical protein